jgi:hypothetical protein
MSQEQLIGLSPEGTSQVSLPALKAKLLTGLIISIIVVLVIIYVIIAERNKSNFVREAPRPTKMRQHQIFNL